MTDDKTAETTDPLTQIKGIGEATARALNAAGIWTATHLRETGAHAAYAAMVAHGTRPHFIGYFALAMVLQGRPWNDCRGAEKEELRAAFDALVVENASSARKEDAGPDPMEHILDAIGTGKRR